MREPYSALLNGEINLDQFYNMFDTKVYPVTDDNPYFLSFEKPLPSAVEVLLYASIGIVAIFLLGTFCVDEENKRRRRRRRNSKISELRIATVIPYFAALGLGFILIELLAPPTKSLILLMGNPTMTFALLLFTVSYIERTRKPNYPRIAKNNMKNLIFVIGGIAGTWDLIRPFPSFNHIRHYRRIY